MMTPEEQKLRRAERWRKWYARNAEKARESARTYRALHIDKYRARDREYSRNNRALKNEQRRRAYHNNKEAFQLRNQKWKDDNPERFKAYKAAWYQKNKDRIRACRQDERARNPQKIRQIKTQEYQKHRAAYIARTKKYAAQNREKLRIAARKRQRDRLSSDPSFRLRRALGSRISQALKGVCKSVRTMELIGCSIDQLKEHLQAQFSHGMHWNNYGTFWSVDHYEPCASFDLTNRDAQMKCFHWTNLRPLTVLENWTKNSVHPVTGVRHRVRNTK